eukprot:CAMPEP_0171640956 /NCGR_PEP_ID=MMETSP0990-20121206/30865_1 /TAXON_ID=483369 /ORGANISM="non described non described, Strain CCMP2098" /LENGTH=52 /DNA_ID=CAMNT_0012215479 /DNA_START=554 /DNA_END=712 /DNA_ORIENTATION=+
MAYASFNGSSTDLTGVSLNTSSAMSMTFASKSRQKKDSPPTPSMPALSAAAT